MFSSLRLTSKQATIPLQPWCPQPLSPAIFPLLPQPFQPAWSWARRAALGVTCAPAAPNGESASQVQGELNPAPVAWWPRTSVGPLGCLRKQHKLCRCLLPLFTLYSLSAHPWIFQDWGLAAGCWNNFWSCSVGTLIPLQLEIAFAGYLGHHQLPRASPPVSISPPAEARAATFRDTLWLLASSNGKAWSGC